MHQCDTFKVVESNRNYPASSVEEEAKKKKTHSVRLTTSEAECLLLYFSSHVPV